MSYYQNYLSHKGRRRRNWKKLHEQKHSRERADQRYDTQLTKDLKKQIIHAIITANKKEAVFLERQSNRKTKWRVKIGDYPHMIIVYDDKRKEIITVLPDKLKYRNVGP